jgi:hypothetical protein
VSEATVDTSSILALVTKHELRLDRELVEAIGSECAQGTARACEVPGQVYEHRVAQNRTGRRAAGAYYTPHHLVDFVIENTLGCALRNRSAGEALELRVFDPACGGGIFLLSALDRIDAHVRTRLAAGDKLPISCASAAERRSLVARSCLFGADIDPIAAEVCRLAILLATDPAAEGLAGANITAADSLLTDTAPPDVQVIVGNPPWGQKGFTFTDEQRAELRRRYRSARGPLDPFKLFVERAITTLRADGCWGMVLPDIVLLKNQQEIRSLMLTQCALDWLVHVERPFDAVNLDAAIIIGRKSEAPPPDEHRVSIWHQLPEDWRVEPPATHIQQQGVFRELPGCKLNLYFEEASLALYRRLRDRPRLGDHFEVHEGVHSGNSRAKLFVDEEGADTVPLIVGRAEVGRFRLDWHGRFLDASPNALDRDAGDYANLGRPEWHTRPKVVVRRTGDRIVAAFDERGFYVSNNLFVVLPRFAMPIAEQRAHVALLNSSLLTWYFRAVEPRTGRLFAELKINHLVDFPLPAGDQWTPRVIGQLASLAEAAEGTDSGLLEPVLAAIDEVVDSLYQLSPMERQQTRIVP